MKHIHVKPQYEGSMKEFNDLVNRLADGVEVSAVLTKVYSASESAPYLRVVFKYNEELYAICVWKE